MSDSLFPPTRLERLTKIHNILTEERGHRERMERRQPDRADYWAKRIAQVEAAIADVDALMDEEDGR